jgi:hypothetical protein
MSTSIICSWQGKELYAPPFRRKQRVIVDVDSESITFEHCHWPRRFWALWFEERYTCQLADILEVHRDSWLTRILGRRRRWPNATIVTQNGQASINARMDGFDEVIAAISPYSKPGSGPLLDNQNVWTIGIVVLTVALTMLGLWWALR